MLSVRYRLMPLMAMGSSTSMPRLQGCWHIRLHTEGRGHLFHMSLYTSASFPTLVRLIYPCGLIPIVHSVVHAFSVDNDTISSKIKAGCEVHDGQSLFPTQQDSAPRQ